MRLPGGTGEKTLAWTPRYSEHVASFVLRFTGRMR